MKFFISRASHILSRTDWATPPCEAAFWDEEVHRWAINIDRIEDMISLREDLRTELLIGGYGEEPKIMVCDIALFEEPKIRLLKELE